MLVYVANATVGREKARGSCHLQRLCSLLFYELANLGVALTLQSGWKAPRHSAFPCTRNSRQRKHGKMPAARHVGEIRMKNSSVTAVVREFNFKRIFILTEFSFWEIICKDIFNFAHITGEKFIKIKKFMCRRIASI